MCLGQCVCAHTCVVTAVLLKVEYAVSLGIS